MTYERSLFSCYVMRRMPMTPAANRHITHWSGRAFGVVGNRKFANQAHLQSGV